MKLPCKLLPAAAYSVPIVLTSTFPALGDINIFSKLQPKNSFQILFRGRNARSFQRCANNLRAKGQR